MIIVMLFTSRICLRAPDMPGLCPAVISQIPPGSGQGGAFILLLQLFMAITSTGSAEIIAVSSLIVRQCLQSAPKYNPEFALCNGMCMFDDLRGVHRRLADFVKRLRTSRAVFDLVDRCPLRSD